MGNAGSTSVWQAGPRLTDQEGREKLAGMSWPSGTRAIRGGCWLGVWALALLIGFELTAARAEAAEPPAVPGYDGVSLFEMPGVTRTEAGLLARARAGDLAGAMEILARLTTRYPDATQLDLLRAVLATAAGNNEAAITALLAADAKGAAELGALLAQPLFAGIAGDPRLAGLTDRPLPAPRDPEPALAQGGTVTIGPEAGTWDPDTGRIRVHVAFPPILQTHAFAENPPPGPLRELQTLVARGFAAGNAGDLYDNRDRGHSALVRGKRTQLTHVVYGPEAQTTGVDYGVNFDLLFEAPTFGNSSTAVTSGPVWRSLPRLALTRPGGATDLWELYANNHIYVFPEHHDHDPEHGDLFPANVPYVLVSQGSSGSDIPLLRAVQAILAAFKPAVKARLTEARLIAPTVQQIFRRAQLGLTDADYMTPRAHPTVFRGEDIDLARAIRLAQALEPDALPPLAMLRLLATPPAAPGVFADGLSEALFETPAAIARVWRGLGAARTYRLAARGFDANGRALSYHWRVIRGDPERTLIEPLDAAGRQVSLTIPWHDPAPVAGRPEIRSARIDIAVFADNGVELSAPAFFSLSLPGHQRRELDAEGRVLAVHAPAEGAYADPLIWPRRNWTDRFRHAPDGTLLGWTRTRPGAAPVEFTADGFEIATTDSQGRPRLVAEIAYPIGRTDKGYLTVTETPTGKRFRITYTGPQDRTGTRVPIGE